MVRKTLLLLLVLSTALMANIGKIVALKGDLTIVRDNTEIIGELGSQIFKADEILTKENAKAQLLFNDNTVITIGKNSVFKVKEYLFDDTNKEYKTNFELLKGSFRTITGKIGKIAPHKFKLNSKTSSIGIRGTQILSKMAVVGDRIICVEGEIIITHIKTGQTIIIKAGEFVDLNVDTKVLKAKTLSQQDIEGLDQDTRFTTNDEKEVQLDNLGVTVADSKNESWGKWNEEPDEVETLYTDSGSQSAGGETNPDVIINATHTATYNGKLEGTHTIGGPASAIKDNASNIFKMTINFGTNQITDGQASGESDAGGFSYDFDGTVKSDGTGFDITNNSGTGTGSGIFYGSNGNIVKGDFEFTSGSTDTTKANFDATSD